MRKSVLVKACTVLMMATLLLSACGQSKGTQKDNKTKTENVTVIVYKDDTGLHFYSMSK